MATMNNHVEVANVLLEAGADVNLQSKVSRCVFVLYYHKDDVVYTCIISNFLVGG